MAVEAVALVAVVVEVETILEEALVVVVAMSAVLVVNQDLFTWSSTSLITWVFRW